MSFVGSDESGKGDFFGGLCVCVSFVDQIIEDKLKNTGLWDEIKDSKKLSNKKVKEISLSLEKILGDKNYSLLKLNAEEYNKKYSEFKNLNALLAWAHNDVWLDLSKKNDLNKSETYIDKFCDPNKYYEYLRSHNIDEVFKIKNFLEKSENQIRSCAISSIIARNHFILEIEDLSFKYNIKIPFGNSYNPKNSVIDAFKKLAQKINNNFIISNFCKNHFKTVEKIKFF